MGEKEQMMSVNEVADFLHVVPMTVYRLIKRGELPSSKVGRVHRISRDAVKQYLKEQESSSQE
jgi:putative molybdopterin biosynthesis protein